jgi:hypothetical protein
MPVVILFAGALFFFVATYFSYVLWQDRVRIGTASQDWPTAPATFVAGTVKHIGSASRPQTSSFKVVIRYTYLVNGTAHSSEEISAAARGFRTRADAQAFLDGYPKSKLVAHYNPANPWEAVLEPGLAFVWHLLVLLPVATGAMALYFLYLTLKALRQLVLG